MGRSILPTFLIALFAFAAPLFVAAQDENSAVWQYYKGSGGSFFAEFPTVPRKSGGNGSDSTATLYKAYFNKSYFFVFSCPTTKCPVFEVIGRLKFRARYMPSAKLIENRRDDGVLETSFSDSEGFYHQIRQITVGSQNLVVHGLSESADDPAVERFLNSLKFVAPEDGALDPDPEDFEKPLASDNNRPESVAKRNSAGNESDTLKEPKTPFVPITILAKSAANYTAAARVYEISGEVILQAKFLAARTVADVQAVRKLPFGLTDEAKIAAQSIRFDPAIREGKPVDSYKSISFTFSIK